MAGALVDVSTDIKAGLGQAFNCETCVQHMIIRVTVDNTSIALNKTRSKNPFARQLEDNSRRVIEHFSKLKKK